MKAYIVSKFGGEWEDSWEHPVCAYADREEAKENADRLTDIVKTLATLIK